MNIEADVKDRTKFRNKLDLEAQRREEVKTREAAANKRKAKQKMPEDSLLARVITHEDSSTRNAKGNISGLPQEIVLIKPDDTQHIVENDSSNKPEPSFKNRRPPQARTPPPAPQEADRCQREVI